VSRSACGPRLAWFIWFIATVAAAPSVAVGRRQHHGPFPQAREIRRLSEVCASAGSIEKDQAEAGQAIVRILVPSGAPKSASSVYSFLMASRVVGCAL
jgi:hypothetical protein